MTFPRNETPQKTVFISNPTNYSIFHSLTTNARWFFPEKWFPLGVNKFLIKAPLLTLHTEFDKQCLQSVAIFSQTQSIFSKIAFCMLLTNFRCNSWLATSVNRHREELPEQYRKKHIWTILQPNFVKVWSVDTGNKHVAPDGVNICTNTVSVLFE